MRKPFGQQNTKLTLKMLKLPINIMFTAIGCAIIILCVYNWREIGWYAKNVMQSRDRSSFLGLKIFFFFHMRFVQLLPFWNWKKHKELWNDLNWFHFWALSVWTKKNKNNNIFSWCVYFFISPKAKWIGLCFVS